MMSVAEACQSMCRDEPPPAVQRVLVFLVVCLILFVPVTTDYYIFLPWLSWHEDRNLFLWLAPFNLGIIAILTNYFLVVFTDPGTVPKGIDPRTELRTIWRQVRVDNALLKGLSLEKALNDIDNAVGSNAKQNIPAATTNGSGKSRRRRSKKHDNQKHKYEPVKSNNHLEVWNVAEKAYFLKMEYDESEIVEAEKQSFTRFKPRYCRDCRNFKPPRTHHSSEMGRCVLKMDHYCPWVNNALGFRNHAHFYRFLASVVWSDICCLALLALRIMDLVKYQNQMENFQNFQYSNEKLFYTPPFQEKEMVYMIVNLILLCGLLLTVGILFVFQTFYILDNTTTIEVYENGKMSSYVKRDKISLDTCGGTLYPYDLGYFGNMKSLLGNNPLLWFVPFLRSPGDGVAYKLSKSVDPFTFVQWPPGEYYYWKKYPYGKPASKKVKTISTDQDSDSEFQNLTDLESSDDCEDESHSHRGVKTVHDTSIAPVNTSTAYVLEDDEDDNVPTITDAMRAKMATMSPLVANKSLLDSLGFISDFEEGVIATDSDDSFTD